ncbi:MAG: glucose-6-phosphate dehydrogenase (coenzyme-F420) [Knoellia sp.]
MRIGYKASAEQFAPAELAGYAVLAEEVGLDSVTISDHFQPWRLEGGHAPNSIAWLSWVAARTERVMLGTSVMTPTYRYNPAVVAQTFATLGCLAPGRIMLGVGTGEALNEVAVGSVPESGWPEFKERFARLRESVTLMRELWTQESVTFEGEYYRTEDARIFDRPEKPIPVYIAAGGPLVARYAGRSGDGFICTSGKGRELYADKLIPAVAEGLGKAGRSGSELDRMIEIKLSWDPDGDQALANTRFWAPLSLTAEQKHSIHSPAQMEKAADQLPIEQVAKRWIVASRPEEVVAAVKEYTDLGFDHLVFHGPGHDQERFLRTFTEQVVPGLRELVPAGRTATTKDDA